MPNLDSTFWDISVYKTLHDEALDMNARQLGPRTTRTETTRLVSEDKSARKRGQVDPYVKTTRTVLLFYNIVQYLYVYNIIIYLFI